MPVRITCVEKITYLFCCGHTVGNIHIHHLFSDSPEGLPDVLDLIISFFDFADTNPQSSKKCCQRD